MTRLPGYDVSVKPSDKPIQLHRCREPVVRDPAHIRGNGGLRRTPIHTPVGDATNQHAAVPGGTTAVRPTSRRRCAALFDTSGRSC